MNAQDADGEREQAQGREQGHRLAQIGPAADEDQEHRPEEGQQHRRQQGLIVAQSEEEVVQHHGVNPSTTERSIPSTSGTAGTPDMRASATVRPMVEVSSASMPK